MLVEDYHADLKRAAGEDCANILLFFAASAGTDDEGTAAVVSYLVGNGFDPNVSVKGMTPLHVACMLSKPKVVKALLKSGADPNLPATKGRTILEIAQKSGCAECERLVLDRLGR